MFSSLPDHFVQHGDVRVGPYHRRRVGGRGEALAQARGGGGGGAASPARGVGDSWSVDLLIIQIIGGVIAFLLFIR
jgi:hypothetical protein